MPVTIHPATYFGNIARPHEPCFYHDGRRYPVADVVSWENQPGKRWWNRGQTVVNMRDGERLTIPCNNYVAGILQLFAPEKEGQMSVFPHLTKEAEAQMDAHAVPLLRDEVQMCSERLARMQRLLAEAEKRIQDREAAAAKETK